MSGNGITRPLFEKASLLAIATCLLVPVNAFSLEEATEYEIKAAYLYNFAKFIEWPATAFPQPNTPMRLCIFDDGAVELSVTQTLKQKVVSGHPVVVSHVVTAEEGRSCHILFITSTHNRQIELLLGQLSQTSVLTVGEVHGFIQKGGIINFVSENGHVRFEVNDKAADQGGLHISSRLLTVAKLVLR
jgi:hypothetical protein